MILESQLYTEDPKVYWDIISSIGTVLAAIATFVTVREMRRSRKDAINPDLYIEQKTISFKPNADDYFFISDEYKFELFNLGNGPAKDVQVKWENKILDRLTNLGINKTPIKGKDHIFHNYENREFFFNQISGEQPQKLNFVLSGNKASSGFFLSTNTFNILLLESLYRFGRSNESIPMYEVAPEKNSILIIEYLDPINKRRTIKFNVTTKVTLYREGNSDKLKKITYTFYFQRKI